MSWPYELVWGNKLGPFGSNADLTAHQVIGKRVLRTFIDQGFTQSGMFQLSSQVTGLERSIIRELPNLLGCLFER